MLKTYLTIKQKLGEIFATPEQKSARFVENFLIPDMLAKGFGFGRAAVGKALIKLKVRSFDDVFDLSADDLEVVRNSRGVGAKVMVGFERYLAGGGRLPDAPAEPPVSLPIETAPTASLSDDEAGPQRIDVV